MHKIQIEIPFRAGHRLLPPFKGKCNNVHGEGFTAIVEIESENLDECGMVADFGPLKQKIKKWIDQNLDHAYIHHEMDQVADYLKEQGLKTYNMVSNPTAEHLAEELYSIISRKITNKVTKVGIVESFRDNIAYYEK